MCAQSLQSSPTLCNPMGCSPPGSSVHGLLQARIPEWVAMPSSGDLPDPGIEPVFLMSPALTDGLLTASTTWEALWDVPSACLSQHTQVKPPSPPAIACKQDHKPGGRAAKPALRNQSPSLLSPVLRSRIFSSLVFHDKIPFVLPFVLSVLGNGVSEMTSLEKERGEAGRKGKQESVGASKS